MRKALAACMLLMLAGCGNDNDQPAAKEDCCEVHKEQPAVAPRAACCPDGDCCAGQSGCSQEEALAQGKPASFWIKQLKDRNAFFRAHAASALGDFGPEARAAVPALTALLKDRDEVVRSSAAAALGEIGPEAKGATEGLTGAAKAAKSEQEQEMTLAALRKIAPDKAKQLEDSEGIGQMKILVARKKIAIGTLIDNPEKYFSLKSVRKTEAPSRALSQFAEVKDQRVTRSLTADGTITKDDLLAHGGNTLAEVLPAGMRAVAIRVAPETAQAGFILPGSRVDVVLTVPEKGNKAETRTILQNVLVLAVDTAGGADKEVIVASTATLALTPEQAEKVIAMQGKGELRLVLRPLGDDKIVAPAAPSK